MPQCLKNFWRWLRSKDAAYYSALVAGLQIFVAIVGLWFVIDQINLARVQVEQTQKQLQLQNAYAARSALAREFREAAKLIADSKSNNIQEVVGPASLGVLIYVRSLNRLYADGGLSEPNWIEVKQDICGFVRENEGMLKYWNHGVESRGWDRSLRDEIMESCR